MGSLVWRTSILLSPLLFPLLSRQGTSPHYPYWYLDLVIWYYLSAQPIIFKLWCDNAVYPGSFEGSDTMTVTKYCLFSSVGRWRVWGGRFVGNCSKLTTWKDGPGPQEVGRCLACFTLTFQKKWRHQEMKMTLHLRTQKHKKIWFLWPWCMENWRRLKYLGSFTPDPPLLCSQLEQLTQPFIWGEIVN